MKTHLKSLARPTTKIAAILLLTLSIHGAYGDGIEIRKAVYEATDGAGGKDVTAQVAGMVVAGKTEIPANYDTFGDPAVMHPKRLRVEFTLDGKLMTNTVAEGGVVELKGSGEPAGPQVGIKIRKAVYEATDGAGGKDVTAQVAGMVAAGKTEIPANYDTFGEPAVMHPKRLRVEFTLDGKPMTNTVAEGGVVKLKGSGEPARPPAN
jgi:hypothetical protein